MALRIDEIIEIPCEVDAGAFPGEELVTIETKTGPVSGFVREDAVKRTASGAAYLLGQVIDIEDDTVVVWLKGSFFTTTGRAYLSKSKLGDMAAAC